VVDIDVEPVEVTVVDGVVKTHPRLSPLFSAVMAELSPFAIFVHELGLRTRRYPTPAQPAV
jgi:hypothetical protein